MSATDTPIESDKKLNPRDEVCSLYPYKNIYIYIYIYQLTLYIAHIETKNLKKCKLQSYGF